MNKLNKSTSKDSAFRLKKENDSPIGHRFVYENDYYKISFVYLGDYKTDVQNNSFELEYLSVDVHEKGNALPITCYTKDGMFTSDTILIDMENILLRVNDISAFYQKIDNAKEAIVFIMQVLKEKFQIMEFENGIEQDTSIER